MKQTDLLTRLGCKDIGEFARKFSPVEIEVLSKCAKKPRTADQLALKLNRPMLSVYGSAQRLCRMGYLAKTERNQNGKYYLP
jgi:predicted transcriptional regulator